MNIEIIKYFSLLFFASEFILMIGKRAKKKGIRVKKDKMSLIIFWLVIPVSLTIGFLLSNKNTWNELNYLLAIIGVLCFAMGIVIRWISIIQLNKDFTVDVAISKNHSLNTSGIYKYIRHPSYLGLLLICFGLSIAMNSILSFAVIMLPILIVILYRIRIEEKLLLNEFGADYTNYSKRTYRLIHRIY